MAKDKKPGIIRLFLGGLWGFVKGHPLITVAVLCVFAVIGVFATYEIAHATSSPKFCKLCHPQEGSGPLSEYHTWSQNIHSFSDVECLDCHRPQPGAVGYARAKVQDGLYDLVMEFVLSDEKKLAKLSEFEGNWERSAHSVKYDICMHCHSDSVNAENREQHWMTYGGVGMSEIDTVVNPDFREINNLIDLENDEVRTGIAANHGLHLAMDYQCAQCHETVSHSGEFISVLNMQTCFDCHDAQRAEGAAPVENEDCETCHMDQVQIQSGTADYGPFTEAVMEWNDKYSSAPEPISWEWSMNLGCTSCHTDPFDISTVGESCVTCHEEDGFDASFIEMYQEGFQDRLDGALSFLLTYMPERGTMSPERRAIFNEYELLYKKIAKDRSGGFHNNEYQMYLLDELETMRADYVQAKP